MANTYKPEDVGVAPPSGGFEQGGWYNGRQYWHGTLSDPGAIHPASDQVGAGQAVSQEVVQQTDPANWDYIQQQQQQQQQQQPTPTPTTFKDSTKSSGQPTSGTGMPTMPEQPTINLPELYKGLTQESGISALEEKYSGMEKEFIEAKANINDNPFLSEASRVGREAKIQKLFDERTANIRGEIATKKADIETQLNLEMKQFDINSQQSQLAWDQFNSLLSIGALDNASGESIAQITRSTGISSDMIYSAIEANKAKNISTSLIQSTAENGEVTVSVIDSNTGNLIKQTSLGIIGNVQGSGTGLSVSEQKEADYQTTITNLTGDIQRGSTLQDLVGHYTSGGMVDVAEVYRIYNMYNPYGKAEEDLKDIEQGIFKPNE